MTKQAKRWTATEEAQARYIQSTNPSRSIAEIVYSLRQVRKQALARQARREAHIARHGYASALRYYNA